MNTTGVETKIHRICSICEACCGLEMTVQDGHITGIRGSQADPFSKGYICPKGVALKDLHEDPDRLRTPLIKRNGRFEEATWDEAFAEINRRLPPLLSAHGRQSTGLVIGNPSAHKASLLLYFPRLAKALGTKNVFSASTLDQMPKQLTSGLMFGHWLSIGVPDIERSDFMLIIGANPAVSNGSLWTVPDFRGKAKALRARGGKIVVVDPRRTETAAQADAHHFIRPGGDVYFLAGMVATLFEEKLVRTGTVGEHLNGMAELETAMRPFTPETVATRCGIDAATIRDLARTLAATERAVVYGRIGTCTQEFGSLASWLIDVINILTGHCDVPGGMMFPKAPAFASNTMGKAGSGRGIVVGRHHSRVSNAPEVFGEFPITVLAEEIETAGEGRIRTLITVASNPVLSSPGGPRLSAALEKLDFMISLDIYLNETSRHADVILPGTSPLEEPHYDVAFPQLSHRNNARYSEAVFPLIDRPAEWEILLRLAAIAEGKGDVPDARAIDDANVAQDVERMAGPQASAVLAQLGAAQGPERLVNLALRGGPYGDHFGLKPDGLTLAKVRASEAGIDLGALQPRIPEMLRTPSGKIELAPPMLIADLARPLARLAEPLPAFTIIGRRDVRSNNSWMHNLPILAKGPFRCTALVHPLDAARNGLKDGAQARITSANRTIDVQVEFSDEMMQGVISLPHGWGHDLEGSRLTLAAKRPGANLNAVLDDSLRDPLSGNAVLSGIAVSISPLMAAE